MDVVLRTVAIFIEVVLLVAIIYSMLNGARLTVFDMGVGPKYNKMVTTALMVIGVIIVTFFIAHLTTFYPAI